MSSSSTADGRRSVEDRTWRWVQDRLERRVADDDSPIAGMHASIRFFRVLAWLFAVQQLVMRWPEVHRPWLGMVILAVLGAWTALMWWQIPTRRLAAIEVAVAVLGIVATQWVDTPEVIASGSTTIPAIWPAAGVALWGALRGRTGGVMAAACIAVADVVEAERISESTAYNIVMVTLMGLSVGFCAQVMRKAHAATELAVAERAQSQERERLARAVHDGVLQVLALAHRHGQTCETGAAVGRAAHEQEVSLRAFLTRPDDASTLTPRPIGETDLAAGLRSFHSSTVTVVAVAEAPMPAARAAEVLAAVGAALDNARQHAGDPHHVWISLDVVGNQATVWVRDNGVGCDPDVLAERSASRIGITRSIIGRMRDIKGHAEITSAPGRGTTVTLRCALLEDAHDEANHSRGGGR